LKKPFRDFGMQNTAPLPLWRAVKGNMLEASRRERRNRQKKTVYCSV
jgi:hypothetical protein